jgi:uncharacterized protein (DUF433 family)
MADTLTPHTESTRGQLGQGIYSLADLRLYLAYYGDQRDGDRALYWLASALNPVAHRRRQPDYSFSDLISLFVVRELLRRNVKPARIRDAEARMRSISGADRPLVSEDIATDGEDVFFATERGHVESANESRKRRTGQQTSSIAIAPYLERIRYHDGSASSWSPADFVELDPRVQFGEPVVEGSRVPTSAVAGLALTSGLHKAAEWLDIPAESAEAALRFEQQLAALRN